AEEALHLAQELMPDLMLVDLNMPRGGLSAVRAIATSCPVIKTVVLTVSEDEEDVLRALKAGTHGYVLKGITARELHTALRAIHDGEIWVTPTLAATLLVEMTAKDGGPRGTPDPLQGLTERERQILECVAAGRSNKE